VLGISAAALLTAAGVIAGSWSVWSAVGPAAPSGNPAPPLWFSPPALEITGTVSSTVDTPATGPLAGHGGADDNPGQTGPAPATTDDHPGPGATTTEDHPAATTTTTTDHSGRGGASSEDDHSSPGGGHG
jgi:hypothetical protein